MKRCVAVTLRGLLLLLASTLLVSSSLSGASSSGLVYSLVVPDAALAPGSQAILKLAVMNTSGHSTELSPPAELVAVIESGATTQKTLLTQEAAATVQALPAGGFLLWEYRLSLPSGLPEGKAILRLSVEDGQNLGAPILLQSTASSASAAQPLKGPTTRLVRTTPAASSLRRTFQERLGAHEPIYFIYGPDAPTAKFQFSFKYKVLDFRELASQRMARTLQFGFTQRSLWDIDKESSPFYDTSYMPEIFYECLAPHPEDNDGWFTPLGFQVSFKHESNGRDGPLSRSLNVVYARAGFAFGDLERWHLLVIPELFGYATSLEDNPRLDEYRGYGKLHMVLGRNDGPSLMMTAWAGKDFNHGSVQLDFSLPIRTKFLKFETYLLIQYFNGYGESLRAYEEHSETVRAGFSLVR